MAKPNLKPPVGAIVARTDAWTMRCLLNQSNYLQLIASGDLVVLHRDKPRAVTLPNGHAGLSIQVHYGYTEPRRSLVVRLHWTVDNVLGREAERDPKQIYAAGFDYHKHSGDSWIAEIKKSPEEGIDYLWKRFRGLPKEHSGLKRFKLLYGRWRKFKCKWFGPMAAPRARLVALVRIDLSTSPY